MAPRRQRSARSGPKLMKPPASACSLGPNIDATYGRLQVPGAALLQRYRPVLKVPALRRRFPGSCPQRPRRIPLDRTPPTVEAEVPTFGPPFQLLASRDGATA